MRFLPLGSTRGRADIQCWYEVMREMDEYYAVAARLPEPWCDELAALDEASAPRIQEIRLRCGQPVLFTIGGRTRPCTELLPRAKVCAGLDMQALRGCFLALCRHSVYAHETELEDGYFTLSGGHRVGVAGTRGPAGFSAVTSLNLRVARWITCTLPQPVRQRLDNLRCGLLVVGAPGSGKTTFLRSMIEYLGSRDRIFSVVDERGELIGGSIRGLPVEHPVCCDVYTHYPRAQGIMMALRTMNPQAIVCDELGSGADAEAVEAGTASGAVFLASAHYVGQEGAEPTVNALAARPMLARLLKTGAFSAAIFLDGRERPGMVSRVEAL